MSGGTRLAAGLLATVLMLLLGSCSYSDDEPGLFGRTPAPVPGETESSAERPAGRAAVPVLGEAIWTSVEPPGIPVRIAVHGVRRVPGGTVLDWSITALSGPGGVPGQPISGGLRLNVRELRDLVLLDGSAGQAYRPLVSRDGTDACLCTPVGLTEERLALGVPRLLQVAYPELPPSTRVVDVSIAPVPVFSRVPVAPLGEVSAPINETDLARPAEPAEPRGRTPDFTLPSGQRFAIEVDAVLASGTLTSVVWTLEALSPGPGPGPGLVPQLARDGAWRVVPLRLRGTQGTGRSCLCSDPVGWRDRLQEPGQRVTVVTNLGEIPRGTTALDVLFPEVPPLRVRVTAASDGAYRSAGTVPGPRRTWTYRPDRPPPGWGLPAWPTPTPRITEGDFARTVQQILP